MAVLLCSFKDAGLERFRSKFYYNSITWKQATGMEWTIYKCAVIIKRNST